MTDPVENSKKIDVNADSTFELIETDPFAGLALEIDHVENDTRGETADVANVHVADEILFSAQVDMASGKLPKHAWERGIMKNVFSDDPLEAFNLLPQPLGFGNLSSQMTVQPSEPAAVDSNPIASLQRSCTLPIYCSAVKVKPQRNYFGELQHVWQSALEKWYRLFDYLGFPGAAGEAMTAVAISDDLSQQLNILRDTLGIKSPRACIKRALSILKYLNWVWECATAFEPWGKQNVLAFIDARSGAGSNLNAGSTLLEAMRFAFYVLGIPIPEKLLKDVQILGKVRRLAAEAPEAKSARPLNVSEVAKLEYAMEKPMDNIDRYLIGCILFAIYSRSRWSDLKFVDELWFDKQLYKELPIGYIESRTKYLKTATSLLKKQRFMPLASPVLVTKVDWTRHWFEAMSILMVDITKKLFGAICRAPGTDGLLSDRPCSSDEIGVFVNQFLGTTTDSRVSSHSFKHTTLSWRASYGLPESARALLGHHEVSGKPLMVYSRDMLSGPLQLYGAMLQNIRDDHFRLDESRTSRLVAFLERNENAANVPAADSTPPACTVPETVHPGVEPMAEVDESETYAHDAVSETVDSSSELPSASESDSSDSEEDGDPPAEHPDVCDIPGPLWSNKKSGIVHKCSAEPYPTTCGRSVDDAHVEYMALGCSFSHARCSRCFKGEVISTREGMADLIDANLKKRARRE